MAMDLIQLIQTKKFAPEELAAKTHEIYDAILRASKHLGGGNFTVIHRNDVVRLVNLGQPWSIGA